MSTIQINTGNEFLAAARSIRAAARDRDEPSVQVTIAHSGRVMDELVSSTEVLLSIRLPEAQLTPQFALAELVGYGSQFGIDTVAQEPSSIGDFLERYSYAEALLSRDDAPARVAGLALLRGAADVTVADLAESLGGDAALVAELRA